MFTCDLSAGVVSRKVEMASPWNAIEMTGTIDAQQHLKLDGDLPVAGPVRVKIIVLYPSSDEADEEQWMHAAAQNPAFDYLKESAEDIYSIKDGRPFHD
jgi:hypothetical protein